MTLCCELHSTSEVEKDTKVVCCKWYSEVKYLYKVTAKVLPKELLRTWFLYKNKTNERTDLHQFRKEPSYDGDVCPCEV